MCLAKKICEKFDRDFTYLKSVGIKNFIFGTKMSFEKQCFMQAVNSFIFRIMHYARNYLTGFKKLYGLMFHLSKEFG
ncbi:MAG: hypothetical protein DRH57_05955 [Candidatus Cloacimonadota bacterium]|nr:MAG: hypothetical protein DRH57_05955 [Candidatus Cloacimonadota bacterium]